MVHAPQQRVLESVREECSSYVVGPRLEVPYWWEVEISDGVHVGLMILPFAPYD